MRYESGNPNLSDNKGQQFSRRRMKKRTRLLGFSFFVCWFLSLGALDVTSFQNYSAADNDSFTYARILAFSFALIFFFFIRADVWKVLRKERCQVVVAILATVIVGAQFIVQIYWYASGTCIILAIFSGIVLALFYIYWFDQFGNYRLESFALPLVLSVALGCLFSIGLNLLPRSISLALITFLPLLQLFILRKICHLKNPAEDATRITKTSQFKNIMLVVPPLHGFCFGMLGGLAVASSASILLRPTNNVFLVTAITLFLAAIAVAIFFKTNEFNIVHRPVMALFTSVCLILPLIFCPSEEITNAGITTGILVFFMILGLTSADIQNIFKLDSSLTVGIRHGLAILFVIIGYSLGNAISEVSGLDVITRLLIVASVIFTFITTSLVFGEVQTIFTDILVRSISIDNSFDLVKQSCAKIGEHFSLSNREIEVFALLASGRDAMYIQKILVISYNTARTHIKNIYKKLDVHSRQELIDLVESSMEQQLV